MPDDLYQQPAPLAIVQANAPAPYQPVRSAMRDEAGRRFAAAALSSLSTILPGVAVSVVALYAGIRLIRAVRSRLATPRRPAGDQTITVQWVENRPQLGHAPRVVEAGSAGSERVKSESVKPPPIQQPTPEQARVSRRARFLRSVR